MKQAVKISKSIAGVKVTGAVIVSVFLAGFGLYKYVEVQKKDATAQTIEAIKPFFKELQEQNEKTNLKVDKVILSQDFALKRDTLINNKIDRLRLQTATNMQEQNKILKEMNAQLPMFLYREPILIDTLKKKTIDSLPTKPLVFPLLFKRQLKWEKVNE